MRKAIVTLLLMVLVSQPVLVFGGTMAVVERIGSPALVAAEPERGCRYSGTELADHVPIFINGTNDFVIQEWPGLGTPASPYVISMLNITYDIDLAGVRIIETDAYFVIRDCFVKQLSALECIQLYNTSHAVIEYTTAISAGASIDCDYANNLQISQSLFTAGDDVCADIAYANNAVLRVNLFSSQFDMGLVAQFCNDLTSENNEYVSLNPGAHCAYLSDCNRTSSVDDHSHGGNFGIWLLSSANATLRGFEGVGNNIGIYSLGSGRIAVTDCHITDADSLGIIVENSANATIDQCSVVSSGQICVLIQHSDNAIVTNTLARGSDGAGMYAVVSSGVLIASNQVYESSEHAVALEACTGATISNNDIVDAGGYGIAAVTCDDAIVQDNAISGVESGIHITSSSNVTAYHNNLWNTGDSGIWFEDGAEANIELNTIELCDNGIGVMYHTNATIKDNTLEYVTRGVLCEEVSNVSLVDNTIMHCELGIQLVDAAFCTVGLNAVGHFGETGVDLSVVDDTTVRDNIIAGPGTEGIAVQGCTNLIFNSNQMTDCGFIFTGTEPVEGYNHTFIDNLVNGLPVYYKWNASDEALTGSSFGQVILVQSENVSVTGGVFYRCTVPVQSFYCEALRLVGITSDENYIGFNLIGTPNSTVSGATIRNTDVGLYAIQCDFLTVDNSHISRAVLGGVGIVDSTYATIQNLTVEYSQTAIGAMSSPYGDVTDSQFAHLSYAGMLLSWGSGYWNVTHCEFLNATHGIRLETGLGSVIDTLVVESQFSHCYYGTYTEGESADGTMVFRSEFYSNGEAIHVYRGDYWHVINCSILWSGKYGIWLSGVTTPEIYGNVIALSGTANGYSGDNYDWDDGVSVGNSWDDYEGTPTYPINGTSNAVDKYPSLFLPTEPIIDSPMDVSYPEFSTGNDITWHPYDDYLRDWSVTIDGAAWAADAWNFDSIVVNIDGLSYGTHTLVLTTWDIDLNLVTDQVTVDVYDDVAPTISHLPNTEAFAGGPPQTLTWHVSDRHPGTYRILRDGNEVNSGPWTNGNISTYLETLAVGVYEYSISLYDADGNAAYDHVIVSVLEDATWPSLDSPADIVFTAGTTGNYVTWYPDDNYPKNYRIDQDGARVESGAWAGSRISFNLDYLDVGNHSFTLTVYDGGGHSTSDSVAVRVIAYEGYTEPVTLDLTTLVIAGAVIGGAVVVVALVYHFRRRGKY